MRKTLTRAAVALSTAALTLGLAGPAHAGLYGIDDPDDVDHGVDVLALSVRNGEDNLYITTTHVNLRRNPASGSAGTIYIDTDKSDSGPEYVFVGGFFEGTDYTLLKTEGFGRSKWGNPVKNGDYQMTVRYAKEKVRIRISQATLKEPDAVRVAVRVSGTRKDGTSVVDWVGQPRAFSLWIPRG